MKVYSGKQLDPIAFPMGGLGAGAVFLQGTGRLGNISIRNKPNYGYDPTLFSAIVVKGCGEPVARVLEAPVPDSFVYLRGNDSGNGRCWTNYGLPRCSEASFSVKFPFAKVTLRDAHLPIYTEILGWSPFIPIDENSSGLPVAALEFTFKNESENEVDAVYYFSSVNFIALDESAYVENLENGFVLQQPAIEGKPGSEGAFCVSTDADSVHIDTAWLQGAWFFDHLTMIWDEISKARYYSRARNSGPASAGGTLAVPFRLAPKEQKTIKLQLSWYVPDSDVREGKDPEDIKTEDITYYKPWYSSVYHNVAEVNKDWTTRYTWLKSETCKFSDCFYDSTLPTEIIDAIAANLCILKSPTILRQYDGRLWGWEGCADNMGQCAGSCTHVYNYAQAICNLFPSLERTLRETEFFETQNDETGMQNFRAYLPIRKTTDYAHPPAADGQLGGILKLYRDWRISGDTGWLRRLWGKAKESLKYCINSWDPEEQGVLVKPHHNTYDIEFWGPDSMCNSFYLGALKAAAEITDALGEDSSYYTGLYNKCKRFLEDSLYNGEYFFHKIEWNDCEVIGSTSFTQGKDNLLTAEGPRYQCGIGCLSDSLVGLWLSEICGFTDLLNEEKVKNNLRSILKYNFLEDFSTHANPQRPGYAINHDAGLLVCSWPHGGKPVLPFMYCNEVWTGIEYQVASHMLIYGMKDEALKIVNACRSRYESGIRNPFDEYEWGHWYVRALASYSLIQAYTGLRYDRLSKTLYFRDNNAKHFRAFLSTAEGYATVVMIKGEVYIEPVSGVIQIDRVVRL